MQMDEYEEYRKKIEQKLGTGPVMLVDMPRN